MKQKKQMKSAKVLFILMTVARKTATPVQVVKTE